MCGSPPADGEPERFELGAIEGERTELSLPRLPVGRHGLSRAYVARNQRRRVIAALLRLLPLNGYARTTIGHITREAGVSRAAFYAQFEGKEECFLAAYDLAGDWFCDRIDRAVSTGEDWPVRVRAGVAEALRLLSVNPDLARLLAVEAQRAGPAARERQQACLTRFAEALRTGPPRCPDGHELPAELEEMLLAGVFAHVARYVDTGRAEQLPEATGQLVRYLLIPYGEARYTF